MEGEATKNDGNKSDMNHMIIANIAALRPADIQDVDLYASGT